MHQVGKVTIYIGIALTVIGLVVGFSAMFTDNDTWAKFFIGLIPVGFVLLLAGTVATFLSAPSEQKANKQDKQE